MNRINFLKKFLLAILVLFVIFSVCNINVYASSISGVISGADGFIEDATDDIKTIDKGSLQTTSGALYNILLAIGTVVAVIIGLILGIKFMTGSIEQKSKVKESLIPYIAGCVVIFGAFGIWKLVVMLVNNLN